MWMIPLVYVPLSPVPFFAAGCPWLRFQFPDPLPTRIDGNDDDDDDDEDDDDDDDDGHE